MSRSNYANVPFAGRGRSRRPGTRYSGAMVGQNGLNCKAPSGAKVGALDVRVLEQGRARPRHGHAALLQHVGAVGKLERGEGILLDHHHGRALAPDVLDDLKGALDKVGSKA